MGMRSVRSDTLCDIRQTLLKARLNLWLQWINPTERNTTMTDRKSVNDKVEAMSAGLVDTVQDLIRDAKPLLHQATDRITDQVSELTQQSREAVRRGKRELESQGHDLMDHASKTIRQEPFKAMLVAAGIGAATVALISIMSRRHS